MDIEEQKKRVLKAIELFFEGKDYFMDVVDFIEVGHIWICHHKSFDTLTVEPRNGGQYEVAVRINEFDKDTNKYEFKGYYVWFNPEKDSFLIGHNTDGH